MRNLLVRIGADISGLTSGMNSASKQLNAFGNQVNKALGGLKGQLAGALAAVVGGVAIKEGTQDAIKYEAIMGTLGESMGASRQDFIKWQEQVGSTMGFSKLKGAELANTLSLNFKKIATDSKDLVGKTTKMMEIAGLIANKRGMLMSEVSDRIRSAMNQEADGANKNCPLRQKCLSKLRAKSVEAKLFIAC